MIKLYDKKIAGRILAFLFAAALIVYPLTDAVSVSTYAASTFSAVPVQQDDDIIILPEDPSARNQEQQNNVPYEELSDEAKASAASAGMPLAGYEVDQKLVAAEGTMEHKQTVFRSVFSQSAVNSAVFGLPASPDTTNTDRTVKTSVSPQKQTVLRKGNSMQKAGASRGASTGLRQSNSGLTDAEWEALIDLGHDTDSKITHFGATYSTEILEGTDTVYTITRDENFGIKYTVTLNTSKEIDVGNAVIRLPSELFKDRDGNPVTIRDNDGIAIPRYSENPQQNTGETPLYNVRPNSIVKSNRTQFGYYIDHDSDGKEVYVIVNYEKIKPGTNWFEVVYDEINVFDVPDAVKDGTITGQDKSWNIQPEIDVQYKYEKERWIFRGHLPDDPVQASLQPIKLRWDEYLADDLNYTGSTLCFSDPGDTSQYLYAKEDLNDFCLYYCQKDDNGQEVQKYKYDYLQSKFYHKNQNDEWELVPLDTEQDFQTKMPRNAVDIAEECERNGETFYFVYDSYNSNESQNGETITLNTYFDHNGDPAYQVRISNGITTYYRVNADKSGWIEEASVRNVLPQKKWVCENFHEDSPELSGIIDTEVTLDSAVKKVGKVTSNISGDLNTESQVLSFIPQEQRTNANIDIDHNVYVLWEIDISGTNCTQPFDMYMDEYVSYYNRQPAYENGTALTYTYYDKATGTICENVSDSQTDLQDGGRIVGVTGLPWDGTFRDSTTYDSTFANSDGLWYLGSSDPSRSNEVQSEGLNRVRTTGSYDKKIYVVAEYPKGAYPTGGVVADQQNGVCIDTLEEVDDGSLVYIPHGALINGKNGVTYDLDTLFKAELGDGYDDTKGNLVDRSVAKNLIKNILDTELSTSDDTEISPLMVDFINELTENLPKTVELKSILEGKTEAEIKSFILNSWKNPGDDPDKKQIQKACNDYLNGILDEHLDRIKISINNTQVSLKSYNEKKIYREVKNNANIILKPIDDQDSTIAQAAAGSHHRVDREPNVKNEFTLSKQAKGGKKGWIDMYDSSDADLFESTISFQVNSSATVFNETHPKSYAYFYDNSSYVHLITADDIITAEPIGSCSGGHSLYGGSCILGPEDYCYTNAKIVVNERVYNIVEDTSAYGASPVSVDALIDTAGGPVDRNWYVYVSYEKDSSGNTEWVLYRTILMEDYLTETNYRDENNGSHVLSLDFMQDARQPFRIKVEHNTIDYQSIVKMNLTAAVKKNSPALQKAQTLRTHLYERDDPTNAAFDDTDSRVDSITLRLQNYAGFHAQKNYLTKDEHGNISSTVDKVLTNESPIRYELVNRQASEANSLILPEQKLTDEAFVTGEALGLEGEEDTIKRVRGYVDLSRLEKKSVAEKTSLLTNDLTHGRAHLTYRIAGYEGYQIDTAYKDDITTIKENNSYTEPGSGRHKIYIYDFLPPGVEFEGYSGSNDKPIAGFVTQNSDISDENSWVTTDDSGHQLIDVSVDIVSENDPAWVSWGGKKNGRYLVRFTLTLPEHPEKYAVVGNGNWMFGCGVRFSANVSWERYSTAKSVPNLAAYVTDSETLGRQNSQVFKDNGDSVPYVNEKGVQDIYSPFRNTDNDPNLCNFDCNDATPLTTHNRMYARSMDLADIARSSSTAIGKQVRANADTFALYSDQTAVIKGDEYTYNINVENQTSGAVSGLILYDVMESASDSSMTWKGILRAVDTSMLALNNITPKVYYHNSVTAKVPKDALSTAGSPTLPTAEEWDAKGWKSAELWDSAGTPPYPLSDVRAVAMALYAADGVTPYVMEGRQTLSYQLLMKAPTDVDVSEKKYAHNRSNYCYYKVRSDINNPTQWITDDSDRQYYNESGNITVVTLGDRRLLKVAKYVEKKYSNVNEIGDMDFTFRVTRRIGYYEGSSFKQGDVPCANIRYRIYHCTFDQNHNIDRLLDEIEPGIIHTTNENGELVLHDEECAVFRYLPSTPLSNEENPDDYDIDNYKITELSKPYWYEYKTSGLHQADKWFYGDDPNEMGLANPQPDDPYNSPIQYYKDRCITITNTYRPVLYVSKNISGVPADMPTNPQGLNADGTKTREDAFNTFDYLLEIHEYPINRITGSFFGNDTGYTDSLDTNHDGQIRLSNGTLVKAAWLKFKEYYLAIPGNINYADTKISALQSEIDALNAQTQATEMRDKQIEKKAWESLKTALHDDKALFDKHIEKAGGIDRFFAPPRLENADHNWIGSGYLMWTVSNRLIMPISGYEENPRDPTYKSFSNKVSEKAEHDRKNGNYLYEYIVGSHTNIYSIPEGWVFWEMSNQENRIEIHIDNNTVGQPIRLSVKSDQVIALPLFISGGMMSSTLGFNTDTNGMPVYGGIESSYLPRYCYRIREDMDNKYWDDIAGEYRTVPNAEGTSTPDLNERTWNVKSPVGNKPYRNTLGVQDENVAVYENSFRFKDIYLKKNVEPADHVPKGGRKNSVDTTAFLYRVTRKTGDAQQPQTIPPQKCRRMTWELWTCDNSGKLLEKKMIGPVTEDGYLLAPIANYEGANNHYRIKIRHAETGYTYYLDEVLDRKTILGESGTAAGEKAFFEQLIPYAEYGSDSFHYRYYADGEDYDNAADKVYYCDSSMNRSQEYTLATATLYAENTDETTGAVQISDSAAIKENIAKVDMGIFNVYKLRNLTVTKSIIARNIDNEMKFTIRLRRQDGGTFSPTEVNFYRMEAGQKRFLTQSEVDALQGGAFTPVLQNTDGYWYLEFKLQNGIYVEFIDVGKENDTYQLQEKDWTSQQSTYIHLDPVDAPGEWSSWKNAVLGDNTISTIRNGDEGYMIITKEYISHGSGDYDECARNYLEGGSHPIYLKFELRTKNSGAGYISPDNIYNDIAFVNGNSINDLSSIGLSGQESAVIDLKTLCSSLGIPYDTVEYQVSEVIPAEVELFNGFENGEEVLYSVKQFTPAEEMNGDKDKTSVEVQNAVTKYNSVIYKRIGGRNTADRPRNKLALVLRDGSGHNRQKEVEWIAIGKTFDRVTAQTGATGEDGRLYVNAYDGWSNSSDDNMTYFVRIFFDQSVACNLVRADDAQLLEIKEDVTASDPSWGYPIGYENYGEPDSYVSEAALESTEQWKREQDTIVNTTEMVSDKKIEVYKIVKPLHTELTAEDRTTEFTFKVRQFVEDIYKDAPGIAYVIYNADGTRANEGVTNELGSFTLCHGQKAELTIPLYSYWEIIEADAGTYRLLVDDDGNVVYDANNNYKLDDDDGLAPSQTAVEKYNAQEAASGYKLNTDLNIVAGVAQGDPVILRRGTWDSNARSYNFILQKTGWNDLNDNSVEQSKAYKDDAIYMEDNAVLRVNNIYGRTIYADIKLTQPIWTADTSGEVYDKVCAFWQGDVDIPEYIYYREPTDIHQLYRHQVVGIASNAFKNDTAISSVKIPGSVKKIGNSAFSGCNALSICTFEQDSTTRRSGLRAIGAYAFKGTAITTFQIPEGTVEIGNSALFSAPNRGFRIYLPKTLTQGRIKILPSIADHVQNTVHSLVEINSGINNADKKLKTRFYSVSNGMSQLYTNVSNSESYSRPNVLILNGLKEIETEAFSDQGEKMRFTSIMVFPEDNDLVVRDFAMVRTNFNKQPFLMVWRSSVVGDADNQGPIFASTGIYNSVPDQGYYNNKKTTLAFTNISQNDTEQIEMIKKRFEIEQDENGWYYNAYNYVNRSKSAYIGGTEKRITVLFKEDVQTSSATDILTNAKVNVYDAFGRVADILASYSGRRSAPRSSPPVNTKSLESYFDPQGLWLLRKRTDNN